MLRFHVDCGTIYRTCEESKSQCQRGTMRTEESHSNGRTNGHKPPLRSLTNNRGRKRPTATIDYSNAKNVHVPRKKSYLTWTSNAPYCLRADDSNRSKITWDFIFIYNNKNQRSHSILYTFNERPMLIVVIFNHEQKFPNENTSKTAIRSFYTKLKFPPEIVPFYGPCSYFFSASEIWGALIISTLIYLLS